MIINLVPTAGDFLEIACFNVFFGNQMFVEGQISTCGVHPNIVGSLRTMHILSNLHDIWQVTYTGWYV